MKLFEKFAIFWQDSSKFLEKSDSRAVQRSALCRPRRELSNAYLLATFGFDTAENEPCKDCPLSAYRSPRRRCGHRQNLTEETKRLVSQTQTWSQTSPGSLAGCHASFKIFFTFQRGTYGIRVILEVLLLWYQRPLFPDQY